MRPVLIIVALMLLILANSKYYLISTGGETGQEISGAGDDADKNKTGDEANQKKTGVKADKSKTVLDADKKKISCDASKNTTVDPHHEAGTNYAIYDEDYGYHSSYNYGSYNDYYYHDYDIPIVDASKFQGVKRLT